MHLQKLFPAKEKLTLDPAEKVKVVRREAVAMLQHSTDCGPPARDPKTAVGFSSWLFFGNIDVESCDSNAISKQPPIVAQSNHYNCRTLQTLNSNEFEIYFLDFCLISTQMTQNIHIR